MIDTQISLQDLVIRTIVAIRRRHRRQLTPSGDAGLPANKRLERAATNWLWQMVFIRTDAFTRKNSQGIDE